MILQKPSACFEPYGGPPEDSYPPDNGCSLAYLGRGFSHPTGSGRLGVAAIGESLGKEEVWDGKPFRPQARAGGKFEEVLRLAGVDREDILVWNIVGCQPPDNRLGGTAYGINAIAHCQVHFDRVVLGLRANPASGKRVLLALGSVPLNTLVRNTGGGISTYRGFVLTSEKYGLVVPTFHPSFIQRGNFELTPLAAMDVQRAIAVAKGEFRDYPSHPDFRGFQINEFPSIDEAWGFYYKCRDNERLLITFDIETPKTGWVTEEERGDIEDAPIIQIQFAINNRSAIVFPWKHPYIDVVLALFKLKNAKANHYAYNFDVPKLKGAGVREINGKIHDTLWMFKHWHPRLPRGLQNVAATVGFPFPWKHFFEVKPQWYGGCDVIAIHYILRWLPERMKKLGVWDGYLEQIRDMYYILGPRPDGSKESASDRGIPVNDEAREQLKVDLIGERRELNKELQKLIPDEVKGIEPRRNQALKGEEKIWDYGYIREPKKLLDACKKVYEAWQSKHEVMAFEVYLSNILVLKTKPDKAGKSKEFRLKKGRFPMQDETGRLVEVERWYREMVFKASSQQLISYLEWKKGELEK